VNTLHRYSDNARAQYAADQIAGYAAATFIGADTSEDGTKDYYTTAATLPDGEPYTMVAVFKRNSSTTQDTLISKFTDASIRALLACQAGTAAVRLQHGTSVISGTITEGAWNYAIASFTGANLLMNVNGVDSTPVTAVGSMGATGVCVGALSAGGVAGTGWRAVGT
jgi:hypothetical protein